MGSDGQAGTHLGSHSLYYPGRCLGICGSDGDNNAALLLIQVNEHKRKSQPGFWRYLEPGKAGNSEQKRGKR